MTKLKDSIELKGRHSNLIWKRPPVIAEIMVLLWGHQRVFHLIIQSIDDRNDRESWNISMDETNP